MLKLQPAACADFEADLVQHHARSKRYMNCMKIFNCCKGPGLHALSTSLPGRVCFASSRTYFETYGTVHSVDILSELRQDPSDFLYDPFIMGLLLESLGDDISLSSNGQATQGVQTASQKRRHSRGMANVTFAEASAAQVRLKTSCLLQA